MIYHVFSKWKPFMENHTLLLQMGNLKIQKMKFKLQQMQSHGKSQNFGNIKTQA